MFLLLPISLNCTLEFYAILNSRFALEHRYNDFYEYFAPHYQLHLTPDTNMQDQNTDKYLAEYKNIILENLSAMRHAPGVQMHHVPPDWMVQDAKEEDDPDTRASTEEKKQHEAEMYDS